MATALSAALTPIEKSVKKNDFLFPYEGRDDIGHSQDKDDEYQKKTG